MMAKPAFPVSFGNLMYFMYQLKNNLWTSMSQSVQSRQALSCLVGQTAPAMYPIWTNHSKWASSSSLCQVSLAPDQHHENKFDHSQVNLTEQRTDLHLTVLKDLVQGKICQIGSELLWAAEEMFSLPIGGKTLQTLNAAETGTSISLPEHYTEPIFLPAVTAKMTELQGHVFCWRPYHESFD